MRVKGWRRRVTWAGRKRKTRNTVRSSLEEGPPRGLGLGPGIVLVLETFDSFHGSVLLLEYFRRSEGSESE
jgi:hypothetical protein